MSKGLTLESVCIQSAGVVTRIVDYETIIVPVTSKIGNAKDVLYTLNGTAQRIWQGFDGKKTIKTVIKELADEFDTPSAIVQKDVFCLTGELYQLGILSVIQYLIRKDEIKLK